MATVKSFTISGLQAQWRLGDGEHGPAHFHLLPKNEKWEVRIYIRACTVGHLEYVIKKPKSFAGLTSKQEKAILAEVLANQNELLREWEQLGIEG